MATYNHIKQALYDTLQSTNIYKLGKMNLKQESFDKFYDSFNKDFKIGKFLGKGAFKITFEDINDSKKVIKIVCTKTNPLSKINELNNDTSNNVVNMNVANVDSHSDLFRAMMANSNLNLQSKSYNSGGYEYSKILSEIKFMFANPDVGVQQYDIHIYANSENIKRIKQNIHKLLEHEKAFYDNSTFNNDAFLNKFIFVETDVSDLESIFVWRETKYIASVKDILEFIKTNSLNNNQTKSSVNSAYSSRTQSPITINKSINKSNKNNNNNNIKLKKEASLEFLIYLLEQINISLEYPDNETILIKKNNISINSSNKRENKIKDRKLMVDNLHSGNYGIFLTNNLNIRNKSKFSNRVELNRSKTHKKTKYTTRIINASSAFGVNISYCKIIELLKRLLPNKKIKIIEPLKCY